MDESHDVVIVVPPRGSRASNLPERLRAGTTARISEVSRSAKQSGPPNRGCSPDERLLHAIAEPVVHTAPVLENAAENRLLDALLHVPSDVRN